VHRVGSSAWSLTAADPTRMRVPRAQRQHLHLPARPTTGLPEFDRQQSKPLQSQVVHEMINRLPSDIGSSFGEMLENPMSLGSLYFKPLLSDAAQTPDLTENREEPQQLTNGGVTPNISR
jgi:hypothetical protein